MTSPGGRRSSPAFPTDEELPVYTVIAPLHREARVVDQLLSGIERLDYPVEILDVIFIESGRTWVMPQSRAANIAFRSR